MQDTFTMDRLSQMRGETVFDSAGEKIGKIEEIFYDEDTNRPEWIGIGTGLFGTKRVLVPVRGAATTTEGLTVAYDKATVKDSPDIDSDVIDEQSEAGLYSYYGLQSSERRAAVTEGGRADLDRQTGLPNAGETSVTRSEEELRVGKREVSAGSVRLRKWVEVEPVQASIDLQRDTVHVHREPIDQEVSGAEIGEQTIEVPLTAEEAVVEKRVIAKERISLDKDVATETETVNYELRKERVETEGDADVADSGTSRGL